MIEPGEIVNLKVDRELHICPSCGYELGFHTSFVSVHPGNDTPVRSTRAAYRVILICPDCGARFDVGWQVTFSEPAPRIMKTTAIHEI